MMLDEEGAARKAAEARAEKAEADAAAMREMSEPCPDCCSPEGIQRQDDCILGEYECRCQGVGEVVRQVIFDRLAAAEKRAALGERARALLLTYLTAPATAPVEAREEISDRASELLAEWDGLREGK